MAAGSYTTSTNLLNQPLVDYWNGSTWTLETTPARPGRLLKASCMALVCLSQELHGRGDVRQQ